MDAGAPIPMVVFALSLGAVAVAEWDEGGVASSEVAPTVPPPTDNEAEALLQALRISVERDVLGRFAAAVRAGDARALATLAYIADHARSVVPALVEGLERDFRNGSPQAVLESGPSVAALAVGVRMIDAAVSAYITTGRAAYSPGIRDLDTAIRMYELAVAHPSVPRSILCICHDNLGLALTEREEPEDLDRALDHFTRALELADNADDEAAVRNNRLVALRMLGLVEESIEEAAALVALLRATAAPDLRIAIALDGWADALVAAGRYDEALTRVTEAATLIPPEATANLLTNALNRSFILRAGGRRREAGDAFVRADALAARSAAEAVDVDHMRTGYRQALAHRLPDDHPAVHAFVAGLQERARGDWASAERYLIHAMELARDGGDHLLGLRANANYSTLLLERQQVAEAVDVCTRVRDAALRYGFAGVAGIVTGNLMSLTLSGAETASASPLLLGHLSRFLLDLHRRILDECELGPDDLERALLSDTGALDNELATMALRHGAAAAAADYYRTALEKAKSSDQLVSVINRSLGLLSALHAIVAENAGDDGVRREIARLVEDLERRVADVSAPRPAVMLHRGLAIEYGESDPRALPHLRAAAAALEALRGQLVPGPQRAEIDRAYGVTFRLVAALHAAAAPAADIFTALQTVRGRALLESSAVRDGEEYRPPSVADVQRGLAAIGPDQAVVDITALSGGLLALIVEASGARSVYTPGDFAELDRVWSADVRRRAEETVAVTRSSAMLRAMAAAVEAALGPETGILIVLDDELANLPLHLVPVGDSSWGDMRSMGRLAAAGALALSPRDRSWTGRSLVAGDSAGDLRGAAEECREVGSLLDTSPLLDDHCGTAEIEARLRDRLDVVHLAVHGRSDVRRGGRSSLLLRGDDGAPRWVPFDRLAAMNWSSQLIVFSGCSTGVGGPRDGRGLYGVAQAAAQAGATTVLASLWPVDDDAAHHLMVRFYGILRRRRDEGALSADLREILRCARDEVREARPSAAAPDLPTSRAGYRSRTNRDLDPTRVPLDHDVVQCLRWGAFTVLGDPIVVLR